jgi:hypothetical protein
MKNSPKILATSQAGETKAKLVVVADLGHLVAYRLQKNPTAQRSRLVAVEDCETGAANHLSEIVTDQTGRFREVLSFGGGASDGEEHNLVLERDRRAVKTLANRVSRLIDRENVDGCFLAADPRINQCLLDEMDSTARAKVEKNIEANLVKLKPDELLQRFHEE